MNKSIENVVTQANEFMSQKGIGGWLLYDYKGMHPIFWDTVGQIDNVTRPCWLVTMALAQGKSFLKFLVGHHQL